MNVKIEKLVYGGDGLGHTEGQTVFVPFVLPGEVVAVRPAERRKKFVRGHLQHIITAAAERVVAPCPHFAACGGCNYQHIPYEAQLAYKQEILRETLSRLGRVKWDAEIHAHASPPFGYRNRVQWKVRQLGDQQAIGYFRSGSSALLPVEQCPIASPLLQESLGALRGALASRQFPFTLREAELFANDADAKLLLSAAFTEFQRTPASLAEALRAALPAAESVLLHESSTDRFELFGPGHITYHAGGAAFRVGHLSFFQVNRHLVEEMQAVVAGGEPGKFALDLFAGVGLFTVPLAHRFERVVAVESNEAATRDLQTNLGAAEGAAQAVCADAAQYLAGQSERPDLVLLDPPRAGIAPPALAGLLKLAPQHIAYLSCDPATLARDLAQLAGGMNGTPGAYEITEVHFFDVFPQTYHIETLVKLRLR